MNIPPPVATEKVVGSMVERQFEKLTYRVTGALNLMNFRFEIQKSSTQTNVMVLILDAKVKHMYSFGMEWIILRTEHS